MLHVFWNLWSKVGIQCVLPTPGRHLLSSQCSVFPLPSPQRPLFFFFSFFLLFLISIFNLALRIFTHKLGYPSPTKPLRDRSQVLPARAEHYLQHTTEQPARQIAQFRSPIRSPEVQQIAWKPLCAMKSSPKETINCK